MRDARAGVRNVTFLQVENYRFNKDRIQSAENDDNSIQTVSYTHLDVYKRQRVYCIGQRAV